MDQHELMMPHWKPPQSVIKDIYGRYKFFGFPNSIGEAAWYYYDEFTNRKVYYGGYYSLRRADDNNEIIWQLFELKTRAIYLPMLPFAELLWLEKEPLDLIP